MTVRDRERDCVRAALRAELVELTEAYEDARTARNTGARVRLARDIKRAEHELDAHDRARAAQIGGAR